MQYQQEEAKKPGREELKQDITDSVKSALKKGKNIGKKVKKIVKGFKRKGRKSKYDDLSAKEMYLMVKQKRDMILSKKGIPAKLPRGKAALIAICKKMKIKTIKQE